MNAQPAVSVDHLNWRRSDFTRDLQRMAAVVGAVAARRPGLPLA
jgi:hypothetical protein